MSRAALLPTLGDPVLLTYWLSLYPSWSHVVDKLYIQVSSSADAQITQYIKKLCFQYNVPYRLVPHVQQHGDNMRDLLEWCTEDYVLFLEDDIFIKDSSSLDHSFCGLESGTYDVIGATRNCASPEIIQATAKKFNPSGSSPEHQIRVCPNLWPGPLFAKREILLLTDRDFNAKYWPAGVFIPHLDFTTSNAVACDTFVWASIQLRAHGAKIGYIHSCHAFPEWQLTEKLANAPWIHYGSLSTISSLVENGAIPPFDSSAVVEQTRRMAFCKLLVDNIQLPQELDYYHIAYCSVIDKYIKEYPLPAPLLTQNLSMLKRVLPGVWVC